MRSTKNVDRKTVRTTSTLLSDGRHSTLPDFCRKKAAVNLVGGDVLKWQCLYKLKRKAPKKDRLD